MADQFVEMMNASIGSTIPIAERMGLRVLEARRGFAAASVPVKKQQPANLRTTNPIGRPSDI